MGVVFTNNAETTLAAAITSTSATSISVTSSSTFPAIQAGEHFYATLDDGTNNEIVKVTGVSGTTWTVVRASDSTTARTFANGITVQLRATAALLTDIQENIAAKSANQTVYNATAASNATAYDVGVNPGVEANAMVFLDGVMQHHDTFSFSGSTLTFDAAPTNGTKIEVIVDNLINLQSSNLTTDTFTATSGQTAFTLSDAPAAENNLIVFIDGVFQDQGTYSISNHTLTLATGAVQGRTVTVYIINPVNIGTPSDGTVTSAKLSGNITMPGTLTVGSHDVAFDSPTFVVDNANSRVGLGTATPSVPVDIVGEVKISSHLNMPDNAIAKFGTGSDLQIYHDGSNSFVADVGTGVLDIQTNGTEIQMTKGGAEYMAKLVPDGAVTLYYDNAAKIATTSTGIDVTGTVVADGLTVDTSTLVVDATNNRVGIGTTSPSGELHVKSASTNANFYLQRSTYDSWRLSAGSTYLDFLQNSSAKMRIDSSGNVLINGTSKFNGYPSGFVTQSIASGTGDLCPILELAGNRNASAGNQNAMIQFYNKTSTATEVSRISSIQGSATNSGELQFHIANAGTLAEAMRITSDGEVRVNAVARQTMAEFNNRQNGAVVEFGHENNSGQYYGTLGVFGSNGSPYIGFSTDCESSANTFTTRGVAGNIITGDIGNGSLKFMQVTSSSATGQTPVERMRIDASGNVGIGSDSISVISSNATTLDIRGGVTTKGGAIRLRSSDSSVSTYLYADNTSGLSINTSTSHPIVFRTAGAEKMRIDAIGDLTVGTSSLGFHFDVSTQLFSTTFGTGGNLTLACSNSSGTGTGGEIFLGGSTRGDALRNCILFKNGSSAERMRIDASGRLLVDTDSLGNASTNAKVCADSEFLSRGSAAGFFWENRTGMTIASQSGWGGWYSTGTASHFLYSDGANRASIGRTSGTYTALSDVNKKKDFEDSTVGLAEVMQLQPKKFRMLEDADDAPKKLGFVAQDVENIIPEAYVEDFADDENEETFIGLTDRPIIAALTKAIQEQQTQIETLKTEIQELKDNG